MIQIPVTEAELRIWFNNLLELSEPGDNWWLPGFDTVQPGRQTTQITWDLAQTWPLVTHRSYTGSDQGDNDLHMTVVTTANSD